MEYWELPRCKFECGLDCREKHRDGIKHRQSLASFSLSWGSDPEIVGSVINFINYYFCCCF